MSLFEYEAEQMAKLIYADVKSMNDGEAAINIVKRKLLDVYGRGVVDGRINQIDPSLGTPPPITMRVTLGGTTEAAESARRAKP